MNNIQSQEVSSDLKQEKKICLCMIVKNESRIISRCLDSAKPIIDYVSICDTGSTDNTCKILEDWCVENIKPVTIHQKTFKNFGYNRSLAVRLAQDTYPEVRVYSYLIDYEISICACYIESKRYLGSDAQKRLESKIDDLPKELFKKVC